MVNQLKDFFLKYGVPCLAVIVIVVHVFYVNTQNLNKWKGGGFGMYTGIHYGYNQIYIPGMSVDSLVKDNEDIKTAFNYLMLMPNKDNLKKAARLVLKQTDNDSIHIQIWKPTIDIQSGDYSRSLIDEIYLKESDL